MRRSNRVSSPARNQPQPVKVGDLVYFHAFSNKDKAVNFLCQGYILRLPTRESRVYKAVIVGVIPFSLTHGVQPELAYSLLGLKIPVQSVSLTYTSQMNTWYNNYNWTFLPDVKRIAIKRALDIRFP